MIKHYLLFFIRVKLKWGEKTEIDLQDLDPVLDQEIKRKTKTAAGLHPAIDVEAKVSNDAKRYIDFYCELETKK